LAESDTDTDVDLNLGGQGAGVVAISNAKLTGTVTGTGVATAATASTLAQRDANGALTATGFVRSSASTVTAAGTTTLTAASPRVQIFTGSSNQTVLLPTTGIVAGQAWEIINLSTGTLTVQSSGANTIVQLGSTRTGTFTAQVDTPTAAADWKAVSPSTANVASTVAQRDSNAWLYASGFQQAPNTFASAAGTTTMTIASTQVQVITGSTTQTVRLPTTSITAGMRYTIINQSSGAVTVQSSGANTISTLAGGTQAAVDFVALKAAPTAATDWRAI
jgi:hypothetical protein